MHVHTGDCSRRALSLPLAPALPPPLACNADEALAQVGVCAYLMDIHINRFGLID